MLLVRKLLTLYSSTQNKISWLWAFYFSISSYQKQTVGTMALLYQVQHPANWLAAYSWLATLAGVFHFIVSSCTLKLSTVSFMLIPCEAVDMNMSKVTHQATHPKHKWVSYVVNNQKYWTRRTLNVSVSSHRTINDDLFQPNHQQNVLMSHRNFQTYCHKDCHQLVAKVMCFEEIIDEWGGCGGLFKFQRCVENGKGKRHNREARNFYLCPWKFFFLSFVRRYFSQSPGVSFYPICTNCKYFMV